MVVIISVLITFMVIIRIVLIRIMVVMAGCLRALQGGAGALNHACTVLHGEQFDASQHNLFGIFILKIFRLPRLPNVDLLCVWV